MCRTADGRFVLREAGEKPLNEDHQGATPKKTLLARRQRRKKPASTPARPNKNQAGCCRPGICRKNRRLFRQPEKDPRSQWDFRIGKNGAIEHFRTEDGHVAVPGRVGDKIHILAKDHDSHGAGPGPRT